MRFLPILLAILLALAACSEEKATVVSTVTQAAGETAAPETDAPEETDAPTDTPGPDVLNLALGSTADVGDARVTVNSVRSDTGGQFLQPDPGNVWLVVDVTVLNLNAEDPYTVSALLHMSTRDTDGREYDSAFGADLNGSLDGTIQPSEQLRGEVAFEVPLTATGVQFVFQQPFGSQAARWNLQ